VKIIDIDLERRRISLSIKQAAEGGVVAAEYQDQFGEHAYDEAGNYIGPEIVVDEPEAVEGAEGAEAVAEGAEAVAEAAPEQAETTAQTTAETAVEAVAETAEAPEAASEPQISEENSPE
jgi:small subunit ribosomal protein S1